MSFAPLTLPPVNSNVSGPLRALKFLNDRFEMTSWSPLFQFAFDQLKVDLDLHVYDSRGNQVGYSGSWDNSYEIAEFPANRGETYTIKIRRWSGTDDVWYGIAWTVQGTPFIRPDWGLTEAVLRAAEG